MALNRWGQLGIKDVGNRAALSGDGSIEYAPAAVAGGLRWKALSAAVGYTCGITTEDRVRACGSSCAHLQQRQAGHRKRGKALLLGQGMLVHNSA